MNKGQLLPVRAKRNPPIIVELAPARLPMRFMAPETDAAYLPPTSMQEAHACGITRSLKKDAAAINAMAAFTSGMRAASNKNRPAPRKPALAISLRVRAMLPVHMVMRELAMPQNKEPIPLNRSGITAYLA